MRCVHMVSAARLQRATLRFGDQARPWPQPSLGPREGQERVCAGGRVRGYMAESVPVLAIPRIREATTPAGRSRRGHWHEKTLLQASTNFTSLTSVRFFWRNIDIEIFRVIIFD